MTNNSIDILCGPFDIYDLIELYEQGGTRVRRCPQCGNDNFKFARHRNITFNGLSFPGESVSAACNDCRRNDITTCTSEDLMPEGWIGDSADKLRQMYLSWTRGDGDDTTQP